MHIEAYRRYPFISVNAILARGGRQIRTRFWEIFGNGRCQIRTKSPKIFKMSYAYTKPAKSFEHKNVVLNGFLEVTVAVIQTNFGSLSFSNDHNILLRIFRVHLITTLLSAHDSMSSRRIPRKIMIYGQVEGLWNTNRSWNSEPRLLTSYTFTGTSLKNN